MPESFAHIWRRRDIGSGVLLEVTTEIKLDDRSDKMVSVDIPLKAYQRLVQWASMQRTLCNAVKICTETAEKTSDNDASIAEEELKDIQDALVAIHYAIRKRHTTMDKTEPVPYAGS